jgi:hypothetical protein
VLGVVHGVKGAGRDAVTTHIADVLKLVADQSGESLLHMLLCCLALVIPTAYCLLLGLVDMHMLADQSSECVGVCAPSLLFFSAASVLGDPSATCQHYGFHRVEQAACAAGALPVGFARPCAGSLHNLPQPQRAAGTTHHLEIG